MNGFPFQRHACRIMPPSSRRAPELAIDGHLIFFVNEGHGMRWARVWRWHHAALFMHLDRLVLASVVIMRSHFIASKKDGRVGYSQPYLHSG
jgi:hypothetical protein